MVHITLTQVINLLVNLLKVECKGMELIYIKMEIDIKENISTIREKDMGY